MKDRTEPTNAGLHLLDTPQLLHVRKAYRLMLRQIGDDPAAAVAAQNVRRYLSEIAAALAERAPDAEAA